MMGVQGSTPNCPPSLSPGRSKEGPIKNEYEESQWTTDLDNQSSTVSRGAPDSPSNRALTVTNIPLASGY